jgi:hypothetical protein
VKGVDFTPYAYASSILPLPLFTLVERGTKGGEVKGRSLRLLPSYVWFGVRYPEPTCKCDPSVATPKILLVDLGLVAFTDPHVLLSESPGAGF